MYFMNRGITFKVDFRTEKNPSDARNFCYLAADEPNIAEKVRLRQSLEFEYAYRLHTGK